MEPLLSIRKKSGYPLDFLCPVPSGPGLSGLDDPDRTGWRAERLKLANIAKACLSHQHREQSIGVGLGVLDAVELLDREAEQQPHEAAALFPIVRDIEFAARREHLPGLA
jgi:hypothetical protein